MLRSETISYKRLRYYDVNTNKFNYINPKDKIILKAVGHKVMSAEVYKIGTKYIELRIAPNEFRGSNLRFYHVKIVIKDIYKIAKYPECSQRMKTIHLVGGRNHFENTND